MVTVVGSSAVIILLLVSALQLTGIISLFADDYGTGLSLDTSADFYEHTKVYEPWPGYAWVRGTDDEIFIDEKEIVAWQPEQFSTKVTARADFEWRSNPRCEGWLCAFGYISGVILGTYWVTVDYIDVAGTATPIINTKTDWFDPVYVYWIRGAPSSRYESNNGHRLPNAQYMDGGEVDEDLAGKNWHTNWAQESPDNFWYPMSTDTIEFKLKGNLVGGLRYKTIIEYAERKNKVLGWDWIQGTALIATDEVYLASGEGEVIITSTNAVSSDGTEVTPETNVIYTKYVYEEGLDVVMQVDAGYSGATLDPGESGYGQGWVLEVYDSTGASRHYEYIPDNVRGHVVTYTIPTGAFIPGDPNDNEWRVVLKNTLFDQSETRLFVIDRFEYMPGQTTISTDKSRYVQWETVYVTLQAYSNVQTGRPIDHFRAWAKYGSAGGTDYAYTVHTLSAQDAGGRSYTASFSFQLTKGSTNIYIRAHAVDDEGRAGPEGEWNVYSEQAVGNYQVTVIVTSISGAPVQGALAAMGASSATSNENGIASLYVDYGSYTLTVSKAGYTTYTQAGIQVQSDTSIPVTLQGGAEWTQYIWYILGGIVAIVALLGAFVYMKRKKMWIFGKKKKRK